MSERDPIEAAMCTLHTVLRTLQHESGPYVAGTDPVVKVDSRRIMAANDGAIPAMVMVVEALRRLPLLTTPHIRLNRSTGEFEIQEEGRDHLAELLYEALSGIADSRALAVVRKLGGAYAVAELLLAKSEAPEVSK